MTGGHAISWSTGMQIHDWLACKLMINGHAVSQLAGAQFHDRNLHVKIKFSLVRMLCTVIVTDNSESPLDVGSRTYSNRCRSCPAVANRVARWRTWDPDCLIKLGPRLYLISPTDTLITFFGSDAYLSTAANVNLPWSREAFFQHFEKPGAALN